MRRAALIALVALMAGCAPSGPPVPVEATLSAGHLVVRTSDGATCRLQRAAAPQDGARGWGGPVAGCAGVVRADVVLRDQPPGPGRVIAGLVRALALESYFAPYAEVRLTGPDGRVFAFASPPPPEPWD